MKLIKTYTYFPLAKSESITHFLLRMSAVFILLILGIEDGKCQSMEWLCRPGEYESMEYAGNDIFRVSNSRGKWGLLRSDGKLLLDVVYDSITPFIEGRAILFDRPSKRLLGIIDDKGEFVKDFSADNVYVSGFPQYKEGRLAFSKGDGKYGYLNENGGVAIDPRFYLSAPFQNGIAAVQYDNTEYGLIRKDGRSAIISDDHFYFMSSPVEGKVLAIRRSRKGGDQLVIMRIDGIGLKKDKVLEDGMNINLSDDFSSIECQLGHSYYLDDQWRVNSASYPAQLPQIVDDLSYLVLEDSSELRGIQNTYGFNIVYLNKPIVNTRFKKVRTYDNNYAVVKSKNGKNGVLKLNSAADIRIVPSDDPVIFQHNEDKEVELNVSMNNINPDKLKIKRVDGESVKECVLQQIDGEWKLKIPFFLPAEKYDEEMTATIQLSVDYDGLEWRDIISEIKSKHKPGYTVNITGSGFTNENGSGTLTLHVKAINGKNAHGAISINGGKPIAFTNGAKDMPLNVSVPEGGSKTFSYNVKVKEEGCPEYISTVSKSVSNPTKNQTEPNDNKKKKIIIQ